MHLAILPFTKEGDAMLVEPPLAQRRIFRRAIKATVRIDCDTPSKAGARIGTGIVLTRDGYILTAYHVVKRRPVMYVSRLRLDDDEWKIHAWGRYTADLVYHDVKTDIAILKLRRPPKTLAVAKLGKSDRIKPGNEIFRVGCDDYELASGYVYDVKARSSMGAPHHCVSMLAAQGMSGGPAFDKQCRVVGSTLELHGVSTVPQWMSYLPIDEIRRRIFSRKALLEVFPEAAKL